MNYAQTLDFLFASLPAFETKGATAYKPGLERIASFCKTMGNPQRNFFTVHVAGTNGKGSVSHIIAAVLQQAGYRTGLYTSPHLRDFRERIRVDGEMIPKQKVVNFVDKYHDKMVEAGLSFFEMTTALAFDYFAQSDVEVAVIETGLGGRLDATNILTPIVSVITNVALEHTDLLGTTLGAVAAEKAGIIKKSIPLVVGERCAATSEVFERRAAELKSKVVYSEDAFVLDSERCGVEGCTYTVTRRRDGRRFELSLDMSGDYQRRNIITVCAVADLLHEETPLTISRRAFVEGLRTAAAATGLTGRWQKVDDEPCTVCDTGHTPYAFEYLSQQLSRIGCKGRKVAVLGFVRDKDAAGIFAKLSGGAVDEAVLVRPSVGRAMEMDEMVSAATAAGIVCTSAGSMPEALAAAREKAGNDGFVFVGGSTYLVADLLALSES